MPTTIHAPPTLGRCPDCGTVIASYDVRIHDPQQGQPAVLAECPHCLESVNPE